MPPAPAGQCSTWNPSKCPPVLTSVSPPNSSFVSPSHAFTTSSGRITHFASDLCTYTGTIPNAWLHSTMVV